ncbi:hypothetical protein LMG28727_07012 [Paraburkholderia kirstenboschensis]|uniref:hypothetical protein n=1 Tax=Paraburkholderia kirstenboschensis TaxID=1245436 RepID=UPI000AB631F2|nr:hypothetical protein [Paraburkholderia kirstenboschensis]CAD6559993.1 hypothetical protein LMG28727_07012 [Paraburkholderia kirstenboschensis]
MAKHGAAAKKSVDVTCVGRGMGRVVLRRFDPERDSFDELPAVLHRAFARLGAMGLNCTCTDQSVSVTKARATLDDCYVVVFDGRLIGSARPVRKASYKVLPTAHPQVIALNKDLSDPAANVRIGSSILRGYLDATQGDLNLALMR